MSETADLLESLRRRRGEREAAVFVEDESGTRPASGVRKIDAPVALDDDAQDAGKPTENAWANQAAKAQGRTSGNHSKRGRASMPSWDEIVFGARGDDDLS